MPWELESHCAVVDFSLLLFTLMVLLCHLNCICSVLDSNQMKLSWFHQTLQICQVKGLCVDFNEHRQVSLEMMKKENSLHSKKVKLLQL